jgi:hypothetical protein
MANFKLTDNAKSEITSEARRLLQYPVAAAQSGFPLTTIEQVQETCIPQPARKYLAGLQAMGAILHESREIMAIVEENDEIPIPVLLQINVPLRMPYVWSEQSHSVYAKEPFHRREAKPMQAQKLPFDLDSLDQPTQEKFIKWINEATRQRRLAFEVTKLVRTFVQEYCDSTAHLLARWGGLKILFNKMPSPWPQRIRDVPRRGLYNWGWDKQSTTAVEWFVENERRMLGAEALLAGASMMDTGTHPTLDTNKPYAQIITWDGGPT